MKTVILLLGLGLIITGCASAPFSKPDDGYAFFTQACEYQESLELKRDSPIQDELRTFLDKGGILSTNLLAQVQQEQKAFSLISDAHNTPYWHLPDITTFSAHTKFPSLSSWIEINRAATVQAIQIALDGKPQDSLASLVPFNTTGLKVAKNGTLIQVLVHIACRHMQYPVLASSIDDLPETSIAEELIRAKEQYGLIPTMQECMAGEQYLRSTQPRVSLPTCVSRKI